MVKVIFVCLGNICRSPTAQGVFAKMVEEADLGHVISVDSAGTHAYHVGSPPDQRAQEAARRRGIDLSPLRGRQATEDDIASFDYVLAMDRDNQSHLLAIAGELGDKVELFLEYAEGIADLEVPDPYYGGRGGFERVIDMIEEASRGLLADIRRRHL